ncbi:Uma2 family endonuclease [Sphaerisporangium corydalis]|uniref:Uma2 family endonuclease n=1 Tax=Sphaerisporangium corydalis TaxID=1441875 RepID=A0ABV9EEX6_9ACTN|nr:Uma2 family endonuclease [Sphaerisporangium corydalis]
MTVEVRSQIITDPELPDWLIPPSKGFTANDLDHLVELPAHTELLDGSLVFVSPQASFHTITLYVLEKGLRGNAPADLRVRREMSVVLGPRQRPEPDLVVLQATADPGPDVTAYEAADILLAVEVVDPASQTRDRGRKPQLYASAGIGHFWRVEQNSGRVTVYVYELDPATSVYSLMGIHHDKLHLTVPFEIEIDLTEIENL